MSLFGLLGQGGNRSSVRELPPAGVIIPPAEKSVFASRYWPGEEVDFWKNERRALTRTAI